MSRTKSFISNLIILAILLAACASSKTATPGSNLPRVLAVESFLADITRNVTGDRLSVDSLIPLGVDPHAYQPTPQDAARITDANVLILNGANLEAFLEDRKNVV
jgi:ABC-type metal ion transport system, periplasmic component/surface adhesin